jgi:photosystem II stability/assembly factor-like uncharacterized protein
MRLTKTLIIKTMRFKKNSNMEKSKSFFLILTFIVSALQAQLSEITTGFGYMHFLQVIKINNEIIVHGNGNKLLKSDDYCQSFSNLLDYNCDFCYQPKLIAADSNTLFLLLLPDYAPSKILKSINRGLTWSTIPALNNDLLTDIVMFNATNGFVRKQVLSTDSSILLRTSDGGISWINFNSPGFINPQFYLHGDSTIYALENSKVSYSNNSGNSWLSIDITDYSLTDLFIVSKDTILVSAIKQNVPYLLKSFNGGINWQYLPITNYANFNSPIKIYFRNLNEIYIFSNDIYRSTGILKTKNVGLSWQLYEPAINLQVNDAVFVDNNIAFLACDNFKFMLWDLNQTTFVSLDKIKPITFNASLIPNPAENQQTLSLNTKIIAPLQIYLSDITGARLKQVYNGVTESGVNSIHLNITQIPSGIYFYEVRLDERIERIRFVKQ